ncbi:Mobile element protein [[Actinomadura] parvosata subsp. kistnae]|nr:Mobile element protein [Actinomadura parvosata subsp. kistnae]
MDGKTLRGSRTGDGVTHLPAAIRHDTQIVLAQRQVEAKSNEIPAFAPLLCGLDLSAMVITADALHTQAEHARQIVAAGDQRGQSPRQRCAGTAGAQHPAHPLPPRATTPPARPAPRGQGL